MTRGGMTWDRVMLIAAHVSLGLAILLAVILAIDVITKIQAL